MSDLILPELKPESLVAVDTETSGLFVDDGARCSIVSIAWYPDGATPGTQDFSYDRGKVGKETLIPQSAAFAFDQGWVSPLGNKTGGPVSPNGGVALNARDRARLKKAPKMSLFADNEDAAPNLDPRYYYELLEWLESMSLVFHNAKFDLHILDRGLRGMEDRPTPDLSRSVSWDTQVANPVLWPEFKTSLKPTAQRLFGEEEADLQKSLQKWLNQNGYRFDLAPWPLVGPYAAKDSEQTLRLYDVQQFVIDLGEAGDPELVRAACEREVDTAIVLYRMERRGIGFDAEGAIAEAEKIAARADALEAEMRKTLRGKYPDYTASVRFTETTVKDLWFQREGLFPKVLTEKGAVSVADDVVRDLEERGVFLAKEYRELNRLNNCLSMWYGTWPKMVGPPERGWHEECEFNYPRLRTSYNQARTFDDGKIGGTVSGRLAVQRVQLQAIPQNYQIPDGIVPIRKFFKADPGHEIWEVDLGQAEFRVAAGVSECQLMLDAFARGDDVHSATCRLMFNMDESHPEWKFHRNVSKRLNFGMLYGAGAPTIRRQIEEFTGQKPALEELQEWLDTYRKTYPELGRMARKTQRQVEHSRRIVLAGGRIRYFHPSEPEHKAFNQLIQGGVAEMMKEAMIRVELAMPGIMMLQIHDSIIVEVPQREPKPEEVTMVQHILESTFEEQFSPAKFISDAEKWKS